MEALEGSQFSLDIPLRPRPIGCPVPLIESQVTYWNALSKLKEPLSIRLRAGSMRIIGLLNTLLLQNSIEAIVHRHDSLRTRIVIVQGTPRQLIDPPGNYHLAVVDLTTTSRADVEREARRLAEEFLERKIDLSIGPLFDAMLFRLSDCDHVLLLALDHIVGDGISNGILSREIWTLYNQAAEGLPTSLPEMPLQFADYAVWLQQTYSARKKKDEAHWIGRMAGAPHVQLPVDSDLARIEQPVGAVLHLPFGKALSSGLRNVAQRERTLLPIVVLATFVAVTSHWCNQRDISVVFVSHGRHQRPELENMIGDLGHLLYFRIAISDGDSLTDLLRRVRHEFLSGMDHQDFVPEIPAERTELMFNWGGFPAYSSRWSVGQLRNVASRLSIRPFRVKEAWPVKFWPFFSDTPAGIVVTVHYRPDLLKGFMIEQFGDNLRAVADKFVQHPVASVTSLSLK